MMAPIPKICSKNEYLELKEKDSFHLLQTPIRKSFSQFVPKSLGLSDSLISKSHQFIGYKRSNEKEIENLHFKESVHSIITQESDKSDKSQRSSSESGDDNSFCKKEKTFKVILESPTNIIQKNKRLAEIVLREKLNKDFFGGKSNLPLEEMIKIIKKATIIAGLYKEKPESTNEGTSCTQSSAISAIQIKETNVQTNQML